MTPASREGGGCLISCLWTTSQLLRPSVHKSRGENVVHLWVQLKRLCVLCECYKGGIVVMDVIWRRLVKYDLRKGDLFVLSWVRVQRVRLGSISSELKICSGAVHSILLLPLVARCLETMLLLFAFQSMFISIWVSSRDS